MACYSFHSIKILQKKKIHVYRQFPIEYHLSGLNLFIFLQIMCSMKIKTYVHALWFCFLLLPKKPPKNQEIWIYWFIYLNDRNEGRYYKIFFFRIFFDNKAKIWSNECESMRMNVYEILSLNFLTCIQLHYFSAVFSSLLENVYLK